MTSPQARKGSGFERDAVGYIRENGFPDAERCYGAGRPDDVGDIDGVPGVVIECKNRADMSHLALWVDEAQREADTDGADFGVVIAKRRMKGIDEAYMVMKVRDGVRLLREARGGG